MREREVDRDQMVRRTRLAVTRTATSAKDITRQKAYQKQTLLRCIIFGRYLRHYCLQIGNFTKCGFDEPVFDFVDVPLFGHYESSVAGAKLLSRGVATTCSDYDRHDCVLQGKALVESTNSKCKRR
jgi:hypothetical protein